MKKLGWRLGLKDSQALSWWGGGRTFQSEAWAHAKGPKEREAQGGQVTGGPSVQSTDAGNMVVGQAGEVGSVETAQGVGATWRSFVQIQREMGETKRFLEGEFERITFVFRNNDFGCSKENGSRVDGSLVDGAYRIMVQRSPTFLAPGAVFVEDNFPRTVGWGWFRDDSRALHLLCTLFLLLLHQLHLSSSGIRSQGLGTLGILWLSSLQEG